MLEVELANATPAVLKQWDALRSEDGFKLVDPDGLLAEPEVDLGIVMREDPLELLEEGPWRRAHRLAALTGLLETGSSRQGQGPTRLDADTVRQRRPQTRRWCVCHKTPLEPVPTPEAPTMRSHYAEQPWKVG